ncbi:MAG TPA: YhjD/YihY/BrkB family envelope integrity protein, partial [Lacipirellulaceae bacterium]|nr:YhjD/YihY/BrkB family envelope integrity protein [Lacipirellulaceae bacterium]
MKLPRTVNRLKHALIGFSAHDGSLVAAGIAYYVALAFFPLMLVLVAGIGKVLRDTGYGQDAQRQILDAIARQASPELAGHVEQALVGVARNAATGGSVGLAALVVTAIAI